MRNKKIILALAPVLIIIAVFCKLSQFSTQGEVAHATSNIEIHALDFKKEININQLDNYNLLFKSDAAPKFNYLVKTDLEKMVEQGIREEQEKQIELQKRNTQTVSRHMNRGETYEITAYDLSIQSCGKAVGSSSRGVTATGVNLQGKSLEEARAVAVDPDRIPLGSKIYITFDESHSYLNGIYTAVDTGGGISGNKIDLFTGDNYSNYPSDKALDFGRRMAKVSIL